MGKYHTQTLLGNVYLLLKILRSLIMRKLR
jgi:hypothetical protein